MLLQERDGRRAGLLPKCGGVLFPYACQTFLGQTSCHLPSLPLVLWWNYGCPAHCVGRGAWRKGLEEELLPPSDSWTDFPPG